MIGRVAAERVSGGTAMSQDRAGNGHGEGDDLAQRLAHDVFEVGRQELSRLREDLIGQPRPAMTGVVLLVAAAGGAVLATASATTARAGVGAAPPDRGARPDCRLRRRIFRAATASIATVGCRGWWVATSGKRGTAGHPRPVACQPPAPRSDHEFLMIEIVSWLVLVCGWSGRRLGRVAGGSGRGRGGRCRRRCGAGPGG
jgi:hypothetical protein